MAEALVEQDEKQESTQNKKIYLQTHKNIQEHYSYEILLLEDNFARVQTNFQYTQTIDEEGMIFDGSIFLAANFSAIAAINQPNTIVVDAKVKFYTPIKKGDSVIFEASTDNTIANKKDVSVIGLINDITVFQGNFITIQLDKKSLLK